MNSMKICFRDTIHNLPVRPSKELRSLVGPKPLVLEPPSVSPASVAAAAVVEPSRFRRPLLAIVLREGLCRRGRRRTLQKTTLVSCNGRQDFISALCKKINHCYNNLVHSECVIKDIL